MDPAVTRLQESERTAEPSTQTREAFSDPDSLSGHLEAVHKAFNQSFPSAESGPYNFIEEVYEDRILARVNEQTLRIAYSRDNTGAVTFGEQTKVKVGLAVTDLEEAAEEAEHIAGPLPGGHILEALDEAEGRHHGAPRHQQERPPLPPRGAPRSRRPLRRRPQLRRPQRHPRAPPLERRRHDRMA